MNKKPYLFILLFSFCTMTWAQTWPHFITDSNYRGKVFKAFEEKRELVGEKFMRDIDVLSNSYEIEALRFLYAYMPLADITDYPTAFHLQNVRASFQAQHEMPWGKDVPELLFRHFVLPVRVNNEALDSSRVVFYRELKERVRHLPMKEAILEVNHWCHEHVTYQPSDGRTLSPLACMKTAIGRCGEESTFTVAALRAVGIPARQVYTPRWAHTDDNHAWVEAWADGQWWFLGACEPEAVLNLGWFNAPASRAMLMHTRAFGDYEGPEEVMLRTSNFTEINLIDNYAETARVDFVVLGPDRKPVSGARVDFKIYNYAEFCTVVTKYTDANGHTFLTAGKGDMLVWASDGNNWGYVKARFGTDKEMLIPLIGAPPEGTGWVGIDIVPPVEKSSLPEVSEEQQAKNKQRLAEEDSIRRAYEGTFYPHGAEQIEKSIADNYGILLSKSRGNWKNILDFITSHRGQDERIKELLTSLSDKDLRDITTEILEDNLLAESNQLCPRVETEMIIRPFKRFFEKQFSEREKKQMRKNPALLVKWVKKNIQLNPDQKSLRIAQTPMGVWESRLTDQRSRDIFFVDLARSLNIEARKDGVTGKVQYRPEQQLSQAGTEAEWIDVNFDSEEQITSTSGMVKLDYKPTKLLDNPKYYSHFTISRIEQGTTHLLNFDEGQVDMGGGVSWENTFKDGTKLDAGTYLLTTGTRLANGSVQATNTVFSVEEGKTTTVPLVLRQNEDAVSVIGSFDSESKFQLLSGDTNHVPASILSQTGRGYFVVGILGMGQEPTNHALRDIAKLKNELDQWGRPFVLLFENEDEAKKYNVAEHGSLPRNIILGIDKDKAIRQQICQAMKLQENAGLPLFIIADTFNRVVFVSQGYTIGLGEQLQKIIQQL